jgi:Tfp pilus assembly PilM family ATPase
MNWWNRTKICPIGIDIGHDFVHMVQLAQAPAGLTVLAAARRPLDPATGAADRPAAAADIVRRLLKQEGFARRSGVMALPDEILHVRTVRVPVDSMQTLSDAASIPEVRRAFDFDLANASPRILEAGEIRQGAHRLRELIVVAARNPDVETWLSEWRKAGVRVESLEVRPCALYRALSRIAVNPPSVQAMLEIGGDRSRVLIGNGPTICFMKSVPVGSEQLNKAVARKLSITPADAAQLRRRLAVSGAGHTEERNDPVRQAVFDATRGSLEELAAAVTGCLRYYAVTFRGPRPRQLALFGADAADCQIRSVLTTALGGISIESPDPLSGIEAAAMKPADRSAAPGEWAGAVGLALKRIRSATAFVPIPPPAETVPAAAESVLAVGAVPSVVTTGGVL